MLVSSFNLLQSVNYMLHIFYKNGSNQRSILSVYGPWAAIQRRGSILAWIIILSVYGADTIAEVKLLILK